MTSIVMDELTMLHVALSMLLQLFPAWILVLLPLMMLKLPPASCASTLSHFLLLFLVKPHWARRTWRAGAAVGNVAKRRRAATGGVSEVADPGALAPRIGSMLQQSGSDQFRSALATWTCRGRGLSLRGLPPRPLRALHRIDRARAAALQGNPKVELPPDRLPVEIALVQEVAKAQPHACRNSW